nr:TPA: ORF1-like protein [Oryctes rhinoceros nudivirus]
MSNGGEQTNGDGDAVFNPKSLQMSVLNMLAGVVDTFPKSCLSMLPKKIERQLKTCHKIANSLCVDCYDHILDKCADDKKTTDVIMMDMRRLFETSYTGFCYECVQKLKTNRELYIKRMNQLLLDEDYWKSYLEEVLLCDESDIAEWDFKSLTVEQALILKNHPEYVPQFCDEDNMIITTSYSTRYIPQKLCASCVGDQLKKDSETLNEWFGKDAVDGIFSSTRCRRQSGESVLKDFLWDKSQWCSNCLYRPLFVIESDDDDGLDSNVIILNPAIKPKLELYEPAPKRRRV